jgi:hypothetical protein
MIAQVSILYPYFGSLIVRPLPSSQVTGVLLCRLRSHPGRPMPVAASPFA